MKAIFYDRKNNREVTSEQLMPTNFIEHVAVGDPDDLVPTGRRVCKETYQPFTREQFDDAKAKGQFRYFDNENPNWEDLAQEMAPAVVYLREKKLGTLCYKSKDCPTHQNYDLHLMLSDLVFLRLE